MHTARFGYPERKSDWLSGPLRSLTGHITLVKSPQPGIRLLALQVQKLNVVGAPELAGFR